MHNQDILSLVGRDFLKVTFEQSNLSIPPKGKKKTCLKCKCLPIHCSRAFKRLANLLVTCVKFHCFEAFEKRKLSAVIFDSKNNPLEYCLRQLDYSDSFIDKCLKGVNFSLCISSDFKKVYMINRLDGFRREFLI